MRNVWVLLLLAWGTLGLAADDYFPGDFINFDTYEKLSHQFFKGWQKGSKFEPLMETANQAIEPEAIHGLLKLLTQMDKTRVTFATFDPVYTPEDGHEIHSGDGLLGLKLVRQVDTETRGAEKSLLSSIQTYWYDPILEKIIPREGPDVLRIRIEVEKFKPATPKNETRGFVGFSWWSKNNKNGQQSEIWSKSYVTDNEKLWLKKGHTGAYHNMVTNCGWPVHCNVCHHRDKRSVITQKQFELSPNETKGAKDFLTYVSTTHKLTKNQTESLFNKLSDPKKNFPVDDLITALKERWKKINQK